MTRAIGFDPDNTSSAWAVVEEVRTNVAEPSGAIRTKKDYFVREVGIFRSPSRTKGFPQQVALAFLRLPMAEFGLVESMEVYERDGMSKVAGLLQLQLTAGAAFACMLRNGTICDTIKPAEWKGQLSKSDHHPRIAKAVGLTIKRGHPTDKSGIAGADNIGAEGWPHIWDAIGLALKAHERRNIIGMKHQTYAASTSIEGVPLGGLWEAPS